MEGQQKNKMVLQDILSNLEFNARSKDFLRQLMQHLDMEESRQLNRLTLIEQIIKVYQRYGGQYEHHMQNPKYNSISLEVKNFLWTVFKQFHEYQASTQRTAPRMPMYSYEPQNLGTNIINMFLDVLTLHNAEEIEVFQRKMFELYKNFMPQVVNSMRMGMPNNFPRTPGFTSYSRQNQHFRGQQYPQRYLYDSQNSLASHSAFPMPKNIMPDFRMGSPGCPPFANYERVSPADDFNSYKGLYSQARLPQQQIGHKMYSQRNIPSGYQYREQYAVHSENSFDRDMLTSPKDRNFRSGLANMGYQPRKVVKKDDQVSIFEGRIIKNRQIECVCKQGEGKTCYRCELSTLDPLNEVEQIIAIEKISVGQLQNFQCTLSEKNLTKVAKNSQRYDIEIRCTKIQRQFSPETTWPDNSKLFIDEELISEFPSLPYNSNLKKRKDKPIFITKELSAQKLVGSKDGRVEVRLELGLEANKQFEGEFVIGVFQIIKLSVQTSFHKILANIETKNVFDFFHPEYNGNSGQSQGEIEKIKIPIVDPFSKNIIKNPVRGANCTHPQCFDLKVFLMMIYPNRQWKCPICGRDARKLVQDEETKQSIRNCQKMIKQPKAIVYYSKGGIQYEYEEEEGSRGEGRPNRVKEKNEPESQEIGKPSKGQLLSDEKQSTQKKQEPSDHIPKQEGQER